jgi:hypothetical protein
MTVTVSASALRGLVDAHFAQRSYAATQPRNLAKSVTVE